MTKTVAHTHTHTQIAFAHNQCWVTRAASQQLYVAHTYPQPYPRVDILYVYWCIADITNKTLLWLMWSLTPADDSVRKWLLKEEGLVLQSDSTRTKTQFFEFLISSTFRFHVITSIEWIIFARISTKKKVWIRKKNPK